jgi:broad specificity phosphatase PhoE
LNSATEKRHLNTGESSGDGPLTKCGIQTIRTTARRAADELKKSGIVKIDRAIISGSVRCIQSFAEIWRTFIKRGIAIENIDIHRKYYTGGAGEDAEWLKIYSGASKVQLLSQINRVGEKKAVLDRAGHLIRPCVNRTVDGIREACRHGATNMVLVTHAPHDTLIAEALTGTVYTECLEVGYYRTIEWE